MTGSTHWRMNGRPIGDCDSASPHAPPQSPLGVFASPLHHASHQGLTLVELLLVLALLVIIGGLSVPMLEGTFGRSRLEHAADLLRAAWSQARLAAMQTGESHVFRYQPQGSCYQVATLTALQTGEADASQPPLEEVTDSATESEAFDLLRLGRHRLPQGVVFASGQAATGPQLGPPAAAPTSGGWSAPILFYADGTATDASLLLAGERQRTLRVTLRGLTGISRVGELGNEVMP